MHILSDNFFASHKQKTYYLSLVVCKNVGVNRFINRLQLVFVYQIYNISQVQNFEPLQCDKRFSGFRLLHVHGLEDGRTAGHIAFRCSHFVPLSVEEKRDLIHSERRWPNCLSAWHYKGVCGNHKRCANYDMAHHTLLHGYQILQLVAAGGTWERNRVALG